MDISIDDELILIIDDEDYAKVKKYRLRYLNNYGSSNFCMYYCKIKKTYKYVHQLILGPKKRNEMVYFKDGNHLNCQKNNISYISKSAFSHFNKKISKNQKGYKGVSLIISARITHKGKIYHLGQFKSLKEAARAYNEKAIELYGPEIAILNEV